MKDCPGCNQPKDEREFSPNPSRPDGLHGECRVCNRERVQERYWRRKRERTGTEAIKPRKAMP